MGDSHMHQIWEDRYEDSGLSKSNSENPVQMHHSEK